ncbi:RNA methyltransferase [Ureaplasma miroungigenitalium]|uniref:RNA methyltransferase n=1 Tax=Ureaplasma miroungigenitalium TaxID=1042321 RepID=A0ABT3BM30_9BACT|nr:RNA methyltransferase [Ureaplasma miroungigenitalium]MCV3728304.1 RNA methyltransferase [Ureaplasma miroungigenitalium]MCV3734109.1 RNA methyltransferase [Ureaplasma miroungigenitalium]
MQIITSIKNPLVVHTIKLVQDKKYREEHQAFVIENTKLLDEAIANHAQITHLFVDDNYYEKNYEQVFPYTLIQGMEIIRVSSSVCKKMSSNVQTGILFAIIKISDKEFIRSSSCLFLDHIQDPGNLGTILRSAVAFNVPNIVLHNCADLYNPKTIKASMGAIFKINPLVMNEQSDAINFLKNTKLTKIASALLPNAISLKEVSKPTAYCLLVGNEGHGLNPLFIDCADLIAKINLHNTESLNVTTATSIFLYSLDNNEQ